MFDIIQERLQEETAPEITKFYVQIDSKGVVIGYSSSKTPNIDEVEVEKDKLSEGFLNLPFFHRYKEDTKEFIFDELLRNSKIKEKNNRLTNDQKTWSEAFRYGNTAVDGTTNDDATIPSTNNSLINKGELIMSEIYKPSGLVNDWRFRYVNKWATDFHISMLLSLKIITEIDAEYIKTGN